MVGSNQALTGCCFAVVSEELGCIGSDLAF
jgi:hypothetical protein